jgi:NAD(P)-dependent dehydrogenase (short-subunit alcohol dehydrogenase family)
VTDARPPAEFVAPTNSEYPRSALLVGGAHGVGRATALRLAVKGTATVLVYRGNDDGAKQTVAEIEALGGTASALKADLCVDAAAIVREALSRLGRIDAIVCTATPIMAGRTMAVSRDQFLLAMDSQAWGLLEVVRAAADELALRRGMVVGCSSLGAHLYAKYYGALGPAKAALETLVKYLAAELGPRQIRVNAVSPCLINDPLHQESEISAPHLEPAARRTPLRRLAYPDDIAAVISALLGPEFAFVTGQVIAVDGGYSLQA